MKRMITHICESGNHYYTGLVGSCYECMGAELIELETPIDPDTIDWDSL